MAALETFPDGLKFRQWIPTGDVRAVVVLVHGLGEHSGRYEALGTHFASRGFAVIAPDHIGHGASPGQRVFVSQFEAYLPGVRQCQRLAATANPDVPCFILGHSMGGLITARLLLEDADRYQGAMLSGPAFAAGDPPGAVLMFIARLLAKWAPGMGMLELDAAGVSRDPAVVADYQADPLVNHGKVTAGLGVAIFDAMALVMSRANEITLPLLVMHGTADRMAAPSGSEAFVEAVGSLDKTLVLLPDLYHEIFNEPEGPDIIAQYADWVDSHL